MSGAASKGEGATPIADLIAGMGWLRCNQCDEPMVGLHFCDSDEVRVVRGVRVRREPDNDW